MAWDGYFEYDGNEIINVARTEAYADSASLPWFRPQFKNDVLAQVLDDSPYTDPATDDAPWYDEHNPYSQEFYGVYPLDITGINDSTATATTVESIADGGVIQQPRKATRAVVFNTILIAASEAGAEYGMQWLKHALDANPCAGSGCVGSNLCYFSSEPMLTLPLDCYDRLQPVSSDPEEVSTRLLRTLRRVQTTVGASVISKRATTDRGAVWNVQFTMTAALPNEFSIDMPLLQGWLDPAVLTPWVGGPSDRPALLAGRNLLPNPSFENGTTGWGAGGAVTLATTTTFSNTGSASLMATKITALGDVGPYTLVGTGGVPVTPLETIYASCRVRSTVSRNTAVWVYFYDAAGATITNIRAGNQAFSTTDWTTYGGSVTAPAGAAFAAFQVLISAVPVNEVHYVDSAMLYRGDDPAPTYFDGDTDRATKYEWMGTPLASVSIIRNTPIRNLMTNPSFEVGTIAGWSNIGSAATISVVTETTPHGTKIMRVTAPQSASTYGIGQGWGYSVARDGGTYYCSIWVRPSRTLTIAPYFQQLGGTGFTASGNTYRSVPGGVWTRLDASATFTGTATAFQYGFHVQQGTEIIGDYVDVDAAMMTTAPGLEYFDGDTPDEGSIYPDVWTWDGAPNASASRQAALPAGSATGTETTTPYVVVDEECFPTSFQPIYDPLCPAIVAPPPPPGIEWGCYTPPTTWNRRRFSVPEESVPQWGVVEPVISLTAATEESRYTRVRIYADPLDTGDVGDDPCNHCADFVVTYVPWGATLVIDVPDKVIYVDYGGVRRRADSLVYSTEGGMFRWPELTCGVPYVVTVDSQVGESVPFVDFTLVGKSA